MKDSDVWEIRKKNEVSPTISPSLLSGESSRLWQKMKEPSQSQEVSLSWEEEAETSRKPKWLEFTGKSSREEIIEWEYCRPAESSQFSISIRVLISLYMWGNNTWLGKELHKRIKGNNFQSLYTASNSACFCQYSGKPHNSQGIRENIQKGFALVMGKN